MPKVQIHVPFQEKDAKELSKTAKLLKVKVAEIIRQRVLTTHKPVSDRERYAYCVEQAARAVPGIPRAQLEQIVGTTIVALHHN